MTNKCKDFGNFMNHLPTDECNICEDKSGCIEEWQRRDKLEEKIKLSKMTIPPSDIPECLMTKKKQCSDVSCE